MYKPMVTLFLLIGLLQLSGFAQNNPSSIVRPLDKKMKHHIVIQLTTADSLAWLGLMHNVTHLLEQWPGNVQIEVVTHGPGIEMMMKTKTISQLNISAMESAGVVFAVCRNTMKARNLTGDDIVPGAAFVPSGVGEVVLKEEEGWSYLKSGY